MKNTLEASFGIPSASTEPTDNVVVKAIIDRDISFQLEVDQYASEYVNTIM